MTCLPMTYFMKTMKCSATFKVVFFTVIFTASAQQENQTTTINITADAAAQVSSGVTTICNETAFEGEVDCNIVQDGNQSNTTNCGEITSDAEVGCNSTVPPASAEAVGYIFDDDDLLIQTTAYELLIRPAWASALSRTLMGWNENLPSQLSSRLPGDTSGGTSITSFCTEISGELIDEYNCATREVWTQLVNGVPGMKSSFSSMSSICDTLGGFSFGSIGQYCALKGAWTQLNERVPGHSSWYGISTICSQLGGTMFGSRPVYPISVNYACMLTSIVVCPVNK